MFFKGCKYVYYEDITVFKKDGSFTVSKGTAGLEAFIVGGGGGGGVPSGVRNQYKAGAKGLGGGVVYQSDIPFAEGQIFEIKIGSGGTGATTENKAGNAGGSSSFGSYAANGGGGGAATEVTTSTAGSDGVACPIENVPDIEAGSLFGASGADGSTTTIALSGGVTGGGKGANRNTDAKNGSFYGSGGGGGEIYKGLYTSTIRKSGNGHDGIVIIRAVVRCKEDEVPVDEKLDVITDTSLTQWIVPSNLVGGTVDVFLVGGGGGGTGLYNMSFNGGDAEGGKGGKVVYNKNITVNPGQSVPIKIGKGGNGGHELSNNNTDGGDTQFMTFVGKGGARGYKSSSISSFYPVDGSACPFEVIYGGIEKDSLYGANGGGCFARSDGSMGYVKGGKTGGGDAGDYNKFAEATTTAGSFYGAGGGSSGVTNNNAYSGYDGKDGYQGIIIIRYHVKKKIITQL